MAVILGNPKAFGQNGIVTWETWEYMDMSWRHWTCMERGKENKKKGPSKSVTSLSTLLHGIW